LVAGVAVVANNKYDILDVSGNKERPFDDVCDWIAFFVSSHDFSTIEVVVGEK